MFPEVSLSPVYLKRQQGSMLVVAVFVIVVMGLLATALSTVFTASETAVSYEVLGIRAQAAANAGIEAGLYQVLRKSVTCNQVADSSVTPTTTLAVTLDTSSAGLSQCTVTVLCGQRPAISGSTATYFILNSTGTCIAGNNQLIATRVIKSEVQR